MSTRPIQKAALPQTKGAAGNSFYAGLIGAVVLACVVGGLLIFAFQRGQPQPARSTKVGPLPAASDREAKVIPTTASSNLVEDDGQTLWMSPTSGQPLDLGFLPPGCQVIVSLRLEGLAQHSEVMKSWDVLGPLQEQLAVLVDYDDSRRALPDPSRLLIGFQITSDGRWQMTQVLRFGESATVEVVEASLAESFPSSARTNYAGKTYWVSNGRAWWVGTQDSRPALVVSPEDSIKDIIDLAGSPPPLRREMERLWQLTDSDRQATLLFVPSILFGDGQALFTGEIARLRQPLFWFLGDGLSAAAWSVNWDENFFVEIVAAPTLDVSAASAASQLAERVRQLPDRIEDYVLGLDPQAYGRRIVARFPEMVRKLAAYTRSGVEDDCAVLRCYLPAAAGHNLILATELTLAEGSASGWPPGGARQDSTVANAAAPAAADSARDRLVRKTSLKFARESLEAALELLSTDIGIEIVILGPDLQADGITRNQQLAMDMADRPAEDILVEILRRANPDKSATGPADPRQKLVYVLRPKAAGGPESIFITTRTAAAGRGEELPAVFRP